MSNTGRRLRESNEEILKYINQLREQRNELGFLVEKQKTEKANLEAERARISYKLNLINKSLSQRVHALTLYDKTLTEIESKYKGLADCTQGLLSRVRQESTTLENSIDKKIGTESDCKNCPNCDVPSNQNDNSEAPTKQPFEGEKQETRNSPTTYKLMSYLEDPSKVAKHPLYYRTMEYPMVLAPMMKDENYQLNNTKIASQNFNQASSSQNEFYYKSSKTEEGSSKMDTPQTDNNPATIEIPAASDTPGTTDTPCTTDTAGTTDTQATTDTPTTTDTPRTMDHPDEDTASSIDTPAPMITQASKDNAATVNTPSTKNTSTTMGTPTLSLDNDRSVEKSTGKPSNTSESSGNFLDGDFPDIKPSKEFSEQQSFSVLLESPPNKKSLSTPSEKPHSRRTSTNSQDKAKPLINEFDEVIEDLSGVPCEENKNPEECQLRKNGKNARSSVEVFRQGYKAQHETEEQLPTLARYKKSVFNKKANYFITEE